MSGFRIGTDWETAASSRNWKPLTTRSRRTKSPQDFPNFNGAPGVTNDLDHDGRSDILEFQADGPTTNCAFQVAADASALAV